ncbi:hypothetical protein [Dactylosporangium sp. NPDC049140]|uniref:hypothetical protein n=1 Tax=Dactylosporangium sp. NPDC049140 TaxID=3155647 RepID=UPI0033D05A31
MRHDRAARPAPARLVLAAVAHAGLAGCGDSEPVLGTSNVCTLFDTSLIDAAVPGGTVT